MVLVVVLGCLVKKSIAKILSFVELPHCIKSNGRYTDWTSDAQCDAGNDQQRGDDMMTPAQIETATLDQLTDELGAAGAYSLYTDIDEARKAVRSIIAQHQQFSVQWEFMGPATQEHFDAAQAVADAMEILGTIETTKDVLAKACQILGRDWDAKSVLAMIENCSFERIDQEASADA